MSAFVVSNRNVIIPSPDGKMSCRLTKGSMGPVPDWVPETPYFKALEADGKVVRSTSRKDKDVRKGQSAAEKARKAAEKAARRAAEKAAGKELGAPEEDDAEASGVEQEDPGDQQDD